MSLLQLKRVQLVSKYFALVIYQIDFEEQIYSSVMQTDCLVKISAFCIQLMLIFIFSGFSFICSLVLLRFSASELDLIFMAFTVAFNKGSD